MTRAFKFFLGVAMLLCVVAGSIYGVRRWMSHRSVSTNASAAPTAMADMSANGARIHTSSPVTTPRGTVTIDARRQQLIGVRIVPVMRASLARTVRAVGIVRYDETRQSDVNLKVEGWIRDLYVDSTGQAVKKGQPLFSVYSPDLVTTQQEYLLALKTRDSLQQSTLADARARADQLVAAARQRLALWDLAPEDLRALDEKRQLSEAIVFRSPANGFVVEKTAVKGLHVMAGQSLYKLADLSAVWVEADVYETDVSGVRVGATAAVSIDAYPGERFSGRVIYVYPYLDEKTRTDKVRFAFVNPRGRLKPGMFADVEVPVGGGMGLTVPTNAVLDSGTEQLVFVAQGDGVFEPRNVKVGRRLGDMVQILDGLKEEEQVATGAAFFLDSESQLRASLQGYDAAPADRGGPAATTGPDITFHTVPAPAKIGDNQLEAIVKDARGKPIDDADVTVQFFMPAMPTMNMPAMRSEATLSPAGGGTYRGIGQVMTAGRWDATVTVMRGGQRLGSKQLPVVAR
jgi:membrane fusion protein, copper/silver efflux system